MCTSKQIPFLSYDQRWMIQEGKMRNSAQQATTLKAVSRLPHILETDSATMREPHRGTGQDVSEDVPLSPNVNPLDSRQLSPNVNPFDHRIKKNEKKERFRVPFVQDWAENDTHQQGHIQDTGNVRDTSGQQSFVAQKGTCRNLGQG